MAVFPMFQKIDGMTFLVVGDGEIARRKTRLIREFTEKVLVIPDREDPDRDQPGRSADISSTGISNTDIISRDHSPDGTRGRLEGKPEGEPERGAGRRFTPSDLEKIDFCIAATDDEARNKRIAALCRNRGIPVNVPDDPDQCTFYLPAVVKRGDLTIAISTDGKSPALAAHLRKEIEKSLPEMTEEILDRMGELRDWVPGLLDSGRERRSLYRELLEEMLSGELAPEKGSVESQALNRIREPAKDNGMESK